MTRHAGMDGKGLLNLVYLTVLGFFFVVFFPPFVGLAEWPRYVQLPNCEASPCC